MMCAPQLRTTPATKQVGRRSSDLDARQNLSSISQSIDVYSVPRTSIARHRVCRQASCRLPKLLRRRDCIAGTAAGRDGVPATMRVAPCLIAMLLVHGSSAFMGGDVEADWHAPAQEHMVSERSVGDAGRGGVSLPATPSKTVASRNSKFTARDALAGGRRRFDALRSP